MTEDFSLFSDPTMARLIEIAEQHFDGTSHDGSASATIRGDLYFTSVSYDGELRPELAAGRVVEALNAALTTARAETREAFAAVPGLSAQLRDALAGSQQMPEDVEAEPASDVVRVFRGSEGEVFVTFDNRAQSFAELYIPSLEHLTQVPKAANRAFAAAQTGQEGATPLDEQIDQRLEQLDQAMEKIEGRLDAVSEDLDKILSNLEP